MKGTFALLCLLLCSGVALACVKGESTPSVNQVLPLVSSSSRAQPLFAVPEVYPWGSVDKQGVQQGLLPGFYNYLSEQSGVAYTGVMLPYSRIVHNLQSGIIDFGVLMDDQTYSNVERVGMVVNLNVLVVTRVDAKPISSMSDLTGKKVGVLRGWETATRLFNEHKVKDVQVNNVNQGLAMLLGKRIDAMIGTTYSIPSAAKALGADANKLRFSFMLGMGSMSLYMAKGSKHAALLPVYQNAIDCIDEQQAQEVFGKTD